MKRVLLVSAVLMLGGCATTTYVERPNQERIARAAEFLPESLNGKVANMNLTPNWFGEGSLFWYEAESIKAEQVFYRIDPVSATKKRLFDRQAVAKQLSLLSGEEVDWRTKPLASVEFDGKTLSFTFKQIGYVCDINANEYLCQREDESASKLPENISPDGRWFIKSIDFNLQQCSTDTQECVPLTSDGDQDKAYAAIHPYPEQTLNDKDFDPQKKLAIEWSPSSRYAITYRINRKGVNKLTLTDSLAENDMSVNTVEFYYPQAGDAVLPQAELVLIDTEKATATKLDAPFVMQTYYGSALWGYWQSERYFYHDRRRGNREYYLRSVDAQSARVETLIQDTDDQFIDPWVKTFRLFTSQDKLIWTSQKDGYQHLYLHDKRTGKLINQITQGTFTVRAIRGLDEENGVVFFEASGVDKTSDPYLRNLYRINLDGSEMRLLTPEVREHDTWVSPDYEYFVDTFSDHRAAPVSVLRSSIDGQVIMKLMEAEVSSLRESGWLPPEHFSVLADDGETRLYGLMYKPSDFDPNKRYPVINDTYTGPHNFFTAKSFNTFSNQRNALAELGFIVIKMDGRGTNKRGKAFHRHSFRNLAAGTDDHVWAIKQLGKDRPYMNLDRVGIFGFSAGGYDVVQAMLRHPEFFKVGVSASGNHDFRVDKAGWNEIWMGWPQSQHWLEQSNLYRVDRLKGKLLLGHGELDSNVHPSATMRLVQALIEADKEFDMLIMPRMGHVLDEHPYWIKKRWQFFVEHLMDK